MENITPILAVDVICIAILLTLAFRLLLFLAMGRASDRLSNVFASIFCLPIFAAGLFVARFLLELG